LLAKSSAKPKASALSVRVMFCFLGSYLKTQLRIK